MSMMINRCAKIQQFSSQQKSRTLENHDFGPLRRKKLDQMCMKFRICMKFLSFIKRTTAPFRTQDALSNHNPLVDPVPQAPSVKEGRASGMGNPSIPETTLG